MKSRFPGMDPYLEQPAFWPDFHSTFINYWREAIADALPPDYEATIGERVYLTEYDPDVRRLAFPDVAVTRLPTDEAPTRTERSGAATLEPVTVPLAVLEGPRETYIEILHHPGRTLVAVLELLSPAKEPPGRTEYLAKRRAILLQDVHLVELDLLLAGRRLPFLEPLPPAHYYYFVSRADRRPDCEVYRWMLPDRLPTLPVPLRQPDGDLLIALGDVFTTAYERGRFRRRLDYSTVPPTVTEPADRQWCEQVVR